MPKQMLTRPQRRKAKEEILGPAETKNRLSALSKSHSAPQQVPPSDLDTVKLGCYHLMTDYLSILRGLGLPAGSELGGADSGP